MSWKILIGVSLSRRSGFAFFSALVLEAVSFELSSSASKIWALCAHFGLACNKL
jgi:hypothetical protein